MMRGTPTDLEKAARWLLVTADDAGLSSEPREAVRVALAAPHDGEELKEFEESVAAFVSHPNPDASVRLTKARKKIVALLAARAPQGGDAALRDVVVPEGPFGAEPNPNDSRWRVTLEGDSEVQFYGTQPECEDVRDVLNKVAARPEGAAHD